MTQLKYILAKSEEQIEVKPECRYRQVTVKLWGKGVILRNEVFGSEIAASKRHVLRCQEFLVSRIDARNGAFGLVPDSLDGAVVSSDFPVFKLDLTRIYPRFLEWMSRTNRFIDICKASSEGTTNRVRLKEDRFLESEISIPSLDKQRRIVARIEELAARIEEARELRRQAAEEADALMNRYAESLFNNSNCDTKPIESSCEVKGGIQKSSKRTPGANPRRYITVAHVQRNWIDTSDPRYFEVSDEELEKLRLLSGDVLVIEGNGSADQIGRTALFSGEIEDCVHQNHVIRIRPNSNLILPDYLNGFLNSPPGQKQMRERSRTTSGLFNLSVGRIKSIDVPLPSLNDQQKIFKKLQAMQSKLDALKRHQAETAAELNALLPAVLERAFRGEL
ncbi:MAG: restriction endonuclease subunit S [Methanothrix sp.]